MNLKMEKTLIFFNDKFSFKKIKGEKDRIVFYLFFTRMTG
jgi:hypothetical protein